MTYKGLPNTGIEPGSPVLQADSLIPEPPVKPTQYVLIRTDLIFHYTASYFFWGLLAFLMLLENTILAFLIFCICSFLFPKCLYLGCPCDIHLQRFAQMLPPQWSPPWSSYFTLQTFPSHPLLPHSSFLSFFHTHLTFFYILVSFPRVLSIYSMIELTSLFLLLFFYLFLLVGG